MEALVERTIVLLADGARADVIDELATQGKLPNISAHIIEPGAKLDAVTVFPSTTGPAYFPFLTGCTPGACNVPGIRWFDKTKFKGLGWPLVFLRFLKLCPTLIIFLTQLPKVWGVVI